MNPLLQQQLLMTRRRFFGDVGLRFGGAALAMMLAQRGGSALASVAGAAPASA